MQNVEEVKKIEAEALSQISEAEGIPELEKLRIKYLGRKSLLNQLFSRIAHLPKENRSSFGESINQLKDKITNVLNSRLQDFSLGESAIDVTFPGQPIYSGKKHILSAVSEKICDIFANLGFVIIEGEEIEDEWHNFNALNIPLEHSSREAFDTFYLNVPPADKKDGQLLLRSHTSPSQIRFMETHRPPLSVISPGRVYRPDAQDASHSFMFHQIEGFCVDKNISFAHLKGVLLHFAKSFFSPDVRLRFRPHFFPFTEPSAEVDISCMICKGRGCSICSHKGWLEILGCGMIHPVVLRNCNINPRRYSGFAFGMGIDRITMLKFGINDIRLFYENDLRFLNQFYE